MLSAALDLFLRQGFSGTSLDDIAQAAHVAKRTIYQQFRDKEGLFSAAIERSSAALVSRFPIGGEIRRDIGADLQSVGATILHFVLQPRSLAIFRLVVGESERQPKLAKIFYELGPGRAVASVAEVLASHLGHRRLPEADLVALARKFVGMTVLELHQRAVLSTLPPASDKDIEKHVASATRAFLAALQEGPQPRRGGKRRFRNDQ